MTAEVYYIRYHNSKEYQSEDCIVVDYVYEKKIYKYRKDHAMMGDFIHYNSYTI